MSKKKKKKGKKFTGEVTKTRAIRIFEVLGFKTAGTWNVIRLQKKIKNLPNLVEGVKFTSKMQKRVDTILNFLTHGQRITVIDIEDAEAAKGREKDVKDAKTREVARKQEKKAKTAKEEKKAAKKDDAKKKAKKPIDISNNRSKPGILASIIEFLQNNAPITKEQILKRLIKRFPGRPPKGMKRTVWSQLPPTDLLGKKKGIKIRKNKEGMFLIKK